jgi:E1A/CREB-binding protein
VVCEISDLFQEYCENKENDATVLPYFEGDYWVNEAEDIIKGVNAKSGGAVKASLALQNGTIEEEEKEEEEKEAGKATKSSNKRKQKRTRTTRSVSQAGFGIRDPVMARLADMVKKMRAALYVAKLRPEPYAKEKWDDRLKEIEKEEHESNESKRPKPGSAVEESQDVAKKVAAKMADTGAPEGEAGAVGVPGALSSASGESEAVVAVEGGGEVDGARAVSDGAVAPDPTAMDTGADEVAAKEDMDKASTRAESKLSKSKSPTKNKVAVAAAAAAADESTVMDTGETEAQSKDSAEGATAATATAAAAGGEAGVAATAGDDSEAEAKGQEGADGGEGEKPVICPPCSPKSGDKGGEEKEGGEAKVKEEKEGDKIKIKEEAKEEENESSDDEEEAVDLATLKDDTSDPDDVMENAYFTTRLEFLDMCIRSHYQFDQLRRSKHTTMMMLYHMHNPDAPKFLPKCDVPTCNMDIMTGHRFHCDSCEVDFCQDCCRKLGSRVHHHVLRAMPVSGTQKVKLTDEQRKERQRSIRVHLQLLQHSSTCTGCRSRHCQKMKEFLKHGANCKMGVKNGCPNCKRIYDLLHWHARSCNKDECPVFKCLEIRAHLKSLLTRQQAMDDRRRHAMNQMYSQGVPGADDN